MTAATPPQTPEVTPSEALLRAAENNLTASRRAAAARLVIARAWAIEHREKRYALPEDAPAGDTHVRELGGTKTAVWEYAPAELAVALEVHPISAQNLMADAVDLHDRLPHVWAAVQGLELEAWVARKIVTLTRELSA